MKNKEILTKELEEFYAEAKNIAEKHEIMKAKWIDVGTEDLFERVKLNEKASNLYVEWKSLYMEWKILVDDEKWQRMIELKTELDENWKKKHTESTAEATITHEFLETSEKLLELKKGYELLYNIQNNIPEYVNVVKLNMKALNPMQWI